MAAAILRLNPTTRIRRRIRPVKPARLSGYGCSTDLPITSSLPSTTNRFRLNSGLRKGKIYYGKRTAGSSNRKRIARRESPSRSATARSSIF
jgi:hypothetical protein